jgi:hypothetical protein
LVISVFGVEPNGFGLGLSGLSGKRVISRPISEPVATVRIVRYGKDVTR